MRKLLLLLFTAFLLSDLTAQGNSLIPRELLFKEKNKFNISMSVDGEYIFYQKKIDGSDSTLYYVSKGSPSGEFRRRFKGTLVNWVLTYQEGLIVVIKEGSTNNLYYSNITAVSERKLNVPAFKNLRFVIANPIVPNKYLVEIEAVNSSQSGYYLVDLFSSNLKYFGGRFDDKSIYFSANYDQVAAEHKGKDGSYSLMRGHSYNWDTVVEETPDSVNSEPGTARLFSVNKDGSQIFILKNNDHGRISLWAVDTRTGETKELASDVSVDVQAEGISTDATGKPIAVNFPYSDKKRLLLDPAYKPDFDFLEKELKIPFLIALADTDNKFWLIKSMGNGPVKYYHYDREAKKLAYLFSDYSYLDGYELAFQRPYSIASADGHNISFRVFMPKDMVKNDGSARLPMPAIIYLYGDPWEAQVTTEAWNMTRHLELLANRGYAVIALDLTKSALKRVQKGESIWNERINNDINEIVNWSIKTGTAQRRRIGLIGSSYGAFIANQAITKTPDQFAAAISINGIADILPFSKQLVARDSSLNSMVGDLVSQKAVGVLKALSPLTHVKQVKTPLLLTAGTLDAIVPQEQSDTYAKGLSDARKEVIYLFYPNEGHEFRSHDNLVSFWAIAEFFLNKNLGGNKQGRDADIELGDFQVMFGDEYIQKIN